MIQWNKNLGTPRLLDLTYRAGMLINVIFSGFIIHSPQIEKQF